MRTAAGGPVYSRLPGLVMVRMVALRVLSSMLSQKVGMVMRIARESWR